MLHVLLVHQFPGAPDYMYQGCDYSSNSFHIALWDGVSESAKALVQGLLQFKPAHRLSAQIALDHCHLWEEQQRADTKENPTSLLHPEEKNSHTSLMDQSSKSQFSSHATCPTAPMQSYGSSKSTSSLPRST